jgi:hypothetical protein
MPTLSDVLARYGVSNRTISSIEPNCLPRVREALRLCYRRPGIENCRGRGVVVGPLARFRALSRIATIMAWGASNSAGRAIRQS